MKFKHAGIYFQPPLSTACQTPNPNAIPCPNPCTDIQSSHRIFNTNPCTSSALNALLLSTRRSRSPSNSHMPTARPYTSAATGQPRTRRAMGRTLQTVESAPHTMMEEGRRKGRELTIHPCAQCVWGTSCSRPREASWLRGCGRRGAAR